MRSKTGLLLLLGAAAVFAGDDVPGWVREAASATVPQYSDRIQMVVLWNEENTTFGENNRVTTTTRTAVKVLNRRSGPIIFYEQYDTSSGKVRDFHAWTIFASGKVRKYGKAEIVDAACQENDVFNQCRKRMVSNSGDIEPGAVFAYEATTERQLYASQLTFHFQDAAPVLNARLQVTLPPSWELKAEPFNGAPKDPAVSGGVYTWEMRNLAPLELEPRSPSVLSLAPWVGINLIGPSARTIATWQQASKMLYELHEGQAEPDAAITGKAQALTQGLSTELEKIAALGRFAQQVNYVSIQVNLAKGGGYRPHAASQVMQKLYGDCKDKANLMRALLKAVGISSYPVAIFSGDRTHVMERWPSLNAFNHAISAIRVSAETRAPAVLDHPQLGRLLFFDPTDPYVPAGHVPDHEQGSLALVGDGAQGGLVRVPTAPAVAASRTRSVEATLQADGSIRGAIVDERSGESMADAIASLRSMTREAYIRAVERWVGRNLAGAVTQDVEVGDAPAKFTLKAKFESNQFAKRPQAAMMIFSAALFQHGDLSLNEKTRRYPIVLNQDALAETVRIALPAGFRADEVPEPVRIDSPYGAFEASWKVQENQLTFQRRIELPAITVAPAEYPELRKFFQRVSSAAAQPVVLIR